MPDRGCWKPVLIGLATVLTLSTGCARSGSEASACPPVVEYPAELQARVAAEVEALAPGAAIETMLVDYHIMRRQAAVCR